MHSYHFLDVLLTQPPFASAYRLQAQTLSAFYGRASDVLGDSCRLKAADDLASSPRRNFFSTLFLAATEALVGPSDRLPLYAMVNQGMRAWVTACDNLLDNEYKEVFAFDLPGRGWRMKSVLTLLLADRVICGYVADVYHDCRLLELVQSVSLRSLMSSALQEHEEEDLDGPTMTVEQIMRDIHRRKTGDLFEAPLALPLAIESVAPDRAAAARCGLHTFGLACQVIDDLADAQADLARGRPNVLVASICRQEAMDWQSLKRLAPPDGPPDALARRYPGAVSEIQALSWSHFSTSFEALSAIGLPCPKPARQGIVDTMFAMLGVPRVPVDEEASR